MIETVKKLLTELVDMMDNGSQIDLDKADEICASIVKMLDQEPCEDCVSRKVVIEAIHKQMYKFVDKAIDEQSEETDDKVDLLLTVNKGITGAIRSLPLAKAEQKSGQWICDSDHPDRLICSTCNCEWDMWRYESKELKYCPNCGSRMKGE